MTIVREAEDEQVAGDVRNDSSPRSLEDQRQKPVSAVRTFDRVLWDDVSGFVIRLM